VPHTSRGKPHVSVWRRGRLMAKAKPANVAFGSHEAEASAAGVAPVRRALVGIGAVLSITSESRCGDINSNLLFISFAPGSPSGDPPPRPELTFSCPVSLPDRQAVRSRTDARIDAADEAAQRGELQIGDMLVEVEGQPISASSVYDAASLLLGPPGEADQCGLRQHVACNRIGWFLPHLAAGSFLMLIWNPIQSAQVFFWRIWPADTAHMLNANRDQSDNQGASQRPPRNCRGVRLFSRA